MIMFCAEARGILTSFIENRADTVRAQVTDLFMVRPAYMTDSEWSRASSSHVERRKARTRI